MAVFNTPSLWMSALPSPKPEMHKYDRGCALVFGGESMTGAARLAATACMRMGAGLCIVVAPTKDAGTIYRTTLPAHIIVEDFTKMEAHLADMRRNVVLIGPGAGKTKDKVLKVLASKKACVLDADALTAFEGDTASLFKNLHDKCVLTPHEGEFKKLFPHLTGLNIQRTEKASVEAGCTVLLKGNDSIIAAAGRDTVTHDESAPFLATAGSGDVLAGMITGLMAQGMVPFEATCAAVYVHRMMGRSFGIGLVASDLPELIPFVLKDLEV